MKKASKRCKYLNVLYYSKVISEVKSSENGIVFIV